MANNKIIDLNALARFKTNCDSEYQSTLVSGTNIKTINNTTLLGSGNYAFDTTFNENSTNALENKVIAREVRELNYKIAVIEEELFEIVLSESDYEVDYATLYAIPDMIDNHRVVYSETQFKQVEGNSVVVNQLAPIINDSNYGFTNATGTISNNVATFTATAQNGRLRLTSSARFKSINTHQYLLMAQIKSTTANTPALLIFYDTSDKIKNITLTTSFQTYYYLVTSTSNSDTATLNICDNRSSDWDAIQVKEVRVIDLTQWFNSDIPTDLTVDSFNNDFGNLIPNTLNTGSIVSTTFSGLKLVGFNQWDEQWELKSLNDITGQFVSGNNICSKNFIKVLPNTTYYIKVNPVWIAQYDANNNYIGATPLTGSTHTFTTSSNCNYIKFQMFDAYGTTYNNDICINISSSLDGTYKPYTTITISIPETELISAGDVHNNVHIELGDIVEGEQLYNLVKDDDIGVVDLGTLEWNYNNSNNVWEVPALADMKTHVYDYSYKPNCIASNYITETNGNTYINNVPMSITISSAIRVFNGNSTTPPTGYLFYELANPTQSVIATGLHFDEISSLIEQGGTIQPIQSGTPCNLTTTFVVKKAGE